MNKPSTSPYNCHRDSRHLSLWKPVQFQWRISQRSTHNSVSTVSSHHKCFPSLLPQGSGMPQNVTNNFPADCRVCLAHILCLIGHHWGCTFKENTADVMMRRALRCTSGANTMPLFLLRGNLPCGCCWENVSVGLVIMWRNTGSSHYPFFCWSMSKQETRV
jgi:hypothetical protein